MKFASLGHQPSSFRGEARLFDGLPSAFTHQEVLEDKLALETLEGWKWATAGTTRRPLIFGVRTALDFDEMIGRLTLWAGG